MEIDPVLTHAYHLKELFRNFNRTAIYPSCINEITSILDAFISADIPAYKDFLTSIKTGKRSISTRLEDRMMTENNRMHYQNI